MSKPYVSIVMRSMNDIKFIGRTLDSVMSQSYKDFELVNIDSGSTDGTFDVVKRFNPGKSRQIRPEEYIPGKVLNSAVKSCSGEIVVFNNSDCIPLDNEWLENLIAPFAKDEKIGATFANARQEGGNHYITLSVQPWDALAAWMSKEAFNGFLRGNVIKYIARDKGGVEDLKKARHYLDKLIEESNV